MRQSSAPQGRPTVLPTPARPWAPPCPRRGAWPGGPPDASLDHSLRGLAAGDALASKEEAAASASLWVVPCCGSAHPPPPPVSLTSSAHAVPRAQLPEWRCRWPRRTGTCAVADPGCPPPSRCWVLGTCADSPRPWWPCALLSRSRRDPWATLPVATQPCSSLQNDLPAGTPASKSCDSSPPQDAPTPGPSSASHLCPLAAKPAPSTDSIGECHRGPARRGLLLGVSRDGRVGGLGSSPRAPAWPSCTLGHLPPQLGTWETQAQRAEWPWAQPSAQKTSV